MKSITKILALLFSASLYGQVYFGFNFDANKAFGIKDNPRTEIDHRGLDFRLEAGAVVDNFGIYITYGRFKSTTTEAEFWQYGAGVDYYVDVSNWIEVSAGVAFNPFKEKDFRGLYENVGTFSARFRTTLYFHQSIGLTLTAKLQQRSDVSKGYVGEGLIGLTLIPSNI